MKTASFISTLLVLVSFTFSATAAVTAKTTTPTNTPTSTSTPAITNNVLDELDPFDPQVEEKLERYDEIYERETGKSAHINNIQDALQIDGFHGCVRENCPIWVQVVKSQQKMYLYLDGQVQQPAWLVSTGIPGRETPNLDTHPDGRIYDSYTSTKFPGGDYDGLGNMPYAVFVRGGIAIHGTGRGNWPKLGHRASHGCIRIHPDNALYFNRMVRKTGVQNVWVTIQD